jgi:Na+/H+ antiporter NhaD/arsenite permease-like protein
MNQMIIAAIIFVLSLALIFSEKLNRTIAAMFGAVLMVGAGILFGFYSEAEAIAAIDFATLGLLLGMMTLVALLQPTGFFEYIAIFAGRWSRGNPVRLMILLGTITTVLSMFLDNVTTVVLLAPVTVLISEIVGLSPAPFLIAQAILSNTGGAGTLVGDPPNVIIGLQADLSFMEFLANALPVVAVSWVVAVGMLIFLFRHELRVRPANADALQHLHPGRALDQPRVALRILIILGVTIAAFFVQEPLGVSPTYIALAGAMVALLWVRPDVQDTLSRIEWTILIFFASLFVLVGGLERSGLLEETARLFHNVVHLPPVLLGVLMIWVVAILSAIVDNIPITIALIPVIHELGEFGIDIQPLWWALVFGAGFGGNGTIIGSSANIVVVSLSERTRMPINALMWSKRGLPVMLGVCATASILFVLLYGYFNR